QLQHRHGDGSPCGREDVGRCRPSGGRRMTTTATYRDYGLWGGPNKLMEGFLQWSETEEAEELKESGASTDFATYMADKSTKRLMWGYGEVAAAWRSWTRTYNVPDFKPISFVNISEMQDLLTVPEGGEYKDSQIDEIVGPPLTVSTAGRM